MIYDFYLYTFFISAFILYLIINDIRKFKPRLYNIIDCKIWIKLYVIINIFFIHAVWLFFTIFSFETNKDIIYGVPPYLCLPYILYLLMDVQSNKYLKDHPNKEIIYYKINKYLNFIISLYIIFIIILVAVPNNIKIAIMAYIIKYIEKFLVYLSEH